MATLDGLVLTFLANALWQVPAVVLAAALAALLLRRAPARHRHALWLAALALAVVLPAASLLRGGEEDRVKRGASDPGPASSFRAERGIRAGANAGSWNLPAVLPAPPAARALTVLYLLSVIVHAGGLARSWRRSLKLLRQAVPPELSPASVEALARCRAAFGPRAAAAPLLAGAAGVGPFTAGGRHPVVVLPGPLLVSSSPAELQSVLGHEFAHVARRDYALNLLGEALLLPVAFHPAVRFLRRRIAAAREVACDELAVERLVAPRDYARALLGLASTLAGLPRPAHTLGVFDADILEERMRRLSARLPLLPRRLAHAALAAALLVLAAAGWGASALALGVEPAATTAAADDLAPFAGTWVGYFEGDAKREHPAGRLTVGAAGPVVLEIWRLHKNPDGSTTTVRFETPATAVATSGGALSFRTVEKEFRFRDWEMAPAETAWTFTVAPDGRGVLTAGKNSYFAAAKERGQAVPPPLPPFYLDRQ